MYLHRKNWRRVFRWIKILSPNLGLFVQIYIQTLPFLKCLLWQLEFSWNKTIWATLKGGYPKILPLKFDDIPPSSLEDVWKKINWRQTNDCGWTDEWRWMKKNPLITIFCNIIIMIQISKQFLLLTIILLWQFLTWSACSHDQTNILWYHIIRAEIR